MEDDGMSNYAYKTLNHVKSLYYIFYEKYPVISLGIITTDALVGDKCRKEKG